VGPRKAPRVRNHPAGSVEPARSRLADREGFALRFAQTPDFTLGVEEELVLVDPGTGELVTRPDRFERAIRDSGGELQAEVFQAMVEAATPVSADVAELADHMARLRAWIVDTAREEGLVAAACGTHPFARWEAQPRSATPRYEQLVRDVGLPMMSDLVFGQHVHVSVGSPQEAIRVCEDIQPFLPLLLALSANAPFWRGVDTGLQSARTNVSAGMPRSGLPPSFDTWPAFEHHVAALREAGAIEDVTELWWDVRPRPELGTVEIRIADLPTELETSVALAALTQALVTHLAHRVRSGQPPPLQAPVSLVEENRWRAMRHGLAARFIEPTETGAREVPLQAFLARTLDQLAPTIRQLGIEDPIRQLRELAEEGRSGADRQRLVYEAEADLGAVVDDLVDRTAP
jgi:carboxylate-amine ligase